MEPQKLFMANILQGALDAEVITLEDLFHHVPARILSQYVPSNILWGVITEGMRRAELGFSKATASPPLPRISGPSPLPAPRTVVASPPDPSPFDVTDGEVTEAFEKATYSVAEAPDDDDEMPPIPEEGIIVEEVDWEDDER